MYTPQTPFESIESAQEYLGLLSKAIADAKEAVDADLCLATGRADQTLRALQLVSYSLGKLGTHIRISHRILNDLRLLGRVLCEGRDSKRRERVFRSSALSQSNAAWANPTCMASPKSPKQPHENEVEVRALSSPLRSFESAAPVAQPQKTPVVREPLNGSTKTRKGSRTGITGQQ